MAWLAHAGGYREPTAERNRAGAQVPNQKFLEHKV
jgi:hypothetical protein